MLNLVMKMGLTLKKINNNGWSHALDVRVKGQTAGVIEFIEGDHRGLVHWEELHGRDGT